MMLQDIQLQNSFYKEDALRTIHLATTCRMVPIENSSVEMDKSPATLEVSLNQKRFLRETP
jgi:hypothetical protein